MTFADALLTTLATPRPAERHLITQTRVDGYLRSECSCKAGSFESLGFDESSISAANWWALEHTNTNTEN